MSEKTPQWAQQRIDEARESGLTELDLSGYGQRERLTVVPDTIAQLSYLQWLRLDGNQLTAIPEAIAQLSNLRWLRLDGNLLTVIPNAIAQLTNLQYLDLNSNHLTDIPIAIVQLTGLQYLDLSENRLMAVPETIAQLSNLQVLRLDGNWLMTVTDAIAQMSNLQWLDLSRNQFTTVPEWLVELPKLERLYLFDNPTVTPPPEVLNLKAHTPVNLESLRAFFRQAQQAARLYEAKLLIVGEPGAGKTSLTRKLLNPTASLPAKDESTEGIDVFTWTFPLPANHEQAEIVNCQSSIAPPSFVSTSGISAARKFITPPTNSSSAAAPSISSLPTPASKKQTSTIG